MRQQHLVIQTNTRKPFGITTGLRVSRLYYLPILFLLLSPALFFNRAKLLSIIPQQENGSRVMQESFISPPALCSTSVQNLLNLPKEKIDVGIAALTFAKEIYPDIDVGAYSAKIDALAERVRRLAKGSKDPDYRVRCLNTVMLLHEKFQGTRDLAVARKSEIYYLNRVLDTKQGNCVSMPFLYIAVSQRLGWPVYQVHVPDHSFVRYVDPKLKQQNIEATSNGGYVSDEGYAKDFQVSAKGRESGAYLRTSTHREVLGDMAAINGITFIRQRDWQKGIAYLELATKLSPRNTAAWNNLTIAYKRMTKHANGLDVQKYQEMAEKGSKKLDELGFVNPQNVPQITSKVNSNGRPI